MPDFNAQMFSCCGFDVEISGYEVDAGNGKGRRVRCGKCDDHFVVPGSLDEAKKAIPAHFEEVHGMEGEVEDWSP